jgi:hypothetical protein
MIYTCTYFLAVKCDSDLICHSISTDMESNPPRVMRDPSNFLKDSTAVRALYRIGL